MNGAQALIRTLVDSDVDVCFMNPGTSEMHFVHALDDVPEMRSILALFEGVATGAADGYARMAGRPAAVLLHLGPGLGNGLANLHNARRAKTPIVNIIGDHATYHAKYDAPLQSDIASIAKGVSSWVRSSSDPETVARDAADTVAAAYGPPGQVATLILPADVSWLASPGPVGPSPRTAPSEVASDRIEDIAAALRSGEPAALLIGGTTTMEGPLRDAARIAQGSGAKLLAETFPTRLQRGAGLPAVDRLAYLAEFAQAQLDGLRHLVLVDSAHPVSFFAYPEKASDLVPEGCTVHVLAAPDEDAPGALAALAAALDAPAEPEVAAAFRPDRPTGALNAETMATALGALLPEDAVVVDEGQTGGLFVVGLHGRGAAPRLAHPHRRRHRLRPARGHRRCRGSARPEGDLPRFRRQCDVHGTGPVDPGPARPRRHDDHPQQRVVRHPQHGARPRRGGHGGTPGPRDARHPRSGLRVPGHGDGGAGHPRDHRRGVHRATRAGAGRRRARPGRGGAPRHPLTS